MKKTISILCLLVLCCSLAFAFTGCFDDDSEKFKQYYTDECPIKVVDTAVITGSEIYLNFENISDKKIIAYEVIYIFYNVYDVQLTPMFSNSPYYKKSYTPTNFVPEKTDYQHYDTLHSDLYYAEVYIYHALFEDKTSWGYKDIPVENITELGKKFKVERYS